MIKANVVFESKHLIISNDEERGILALKWAGYLNTIDFRNAAREVLNAVEKTGANAILSDNTDWKIITPNDHGWAAFNWFPEAEERGVKMLATVLSNDYFNRIAERSIESMAEVRCMEIRNFKEMNEAEAWLTGTTGKKAQKNSLCDSSH